MADGRKPAFTGLEERFVSDKDKNELNKVLKELEGYIAQAKKALDGGVSPADFQKLSKYRVALEQAHDCVSLVWTASVKP